MATPESTARREAFMARYGLHDSRGRTDTLPGLAPFEIVIDDAQMAEVKRRLGNIPRGLPTVMSRAINRAQRVVKGQVSKRVSKKLEAPLSIIRKLLPIYWASKTKLISTLRVRPYGFSLYWWDPVVETPGALFEVGSLRTGKGRFVATGGGVRLRKGDRRFIPHAFIAFVRRGQVRPGVYIRMGKMRFPLKHLKTPTLLDEFYEMGGKAYFTRLAQSEVNKRLDAEVNLLLTGKRAPILDVPVEDSTQWDTGGTA